MTTTMQALRIEAEGRSALCTIEKPTPAATEEDQKVIDKMKAEGVEVIYPDIAPFKEKTLSVYQKFPEWSPNLYETIQKQLQ